MPLDKYQQAVFNEAAKQYINKYQAKPTPVSSPPPPKIVSDDLYEALKSNGNIFASAPPLATDWITSWGVSKSLPKATPKDEVIIPAAPHPISDEPEGEFYIKKVAQPNPLSTYEGLENVKNQLQQMMLEAESKGIQIPKMLTRAYMRIVHLEDVAQFGGDNNQFYKNGYHDGYHDGEHKNPHAFVDAPDDVESDENQF